MYYIDPLIWHVCGTTIIYINIIRMQLYVPYSLDRKQRLLFISLPEFVWRLLIPVAAREAIHRETVD